MPHVNRKVRWIRKRWTNSENSLVELREDFQGSGTNLTLVTQFTVEKNEEESG